MDEDARTIWCGNLSENISEEILYELFLQAGPLQRVRIPKTREGKSRNFGFVTFKHQCSVPYALALFEGTELFKKSLRLQSRNPDRIKLDPPHSSFARDGPHNRSQSLPGRFESPHNGINALSYDKLLLLGQSMLHGSSLQGNHANAYSSQSGNMYSSQSGTSPYLGGTNKYSDLTARSLQGNWSNRNHPYARGSGSGSGSGGSNKRQKNERSYHRR